MTWTLWRGTWQPSHFTLRLVIKDKAIKVSSATTELWSGLAEEELEAATLERYTDIPLLPGDTFSYKLVLPSHANESLSLLFIAFCHLSDSCEFLMLHRKIWNRGSMCPKSRGSPNKRFANSGLKITRTSGIVGTFCCVEVVAFVGNVANTFLAALSAL